MKNKLTPFIVNAVLCAIIAVTCVVGFADGNAVQVSGEHDQPYYSAKETACGVSLMFNVYQNTSNVYKILDILNEFDVCATFFLGGCWADDNVDCVREIAKNGHEIGSHGYFHKDHSVMTYRQNYDEISPSIKLLNAILGSDISLFAPPSGAFNENTLSACSMLGVKAIMWSRDTIDWRDSDTKLICERATQNIVNGEFILMHPMDVTVAALPDIISYISSSGLSFVTVSKNLGE